MSEILSIIFTDCICACRTLVPQPFSSGNDRHNDHVDPKCAPRNPTLIACIQLRPSARCPSLVRDGRLRAVRSSLHCSHLQEDKTILKTLCRSKLSKQHTSGKVFLVANNDHVDLQEGDQIRGDVLRRIDEGIIHILTEAANNKLEE